MGGRRHDASVRAAAFSAALLFAAPLAAAAQASEAGPMPTEWAFRWLNFALVVACGWWAWRKLKVILRRRAEMIAATIAEAEAARANAEAALAAAEARLQALEGEVTELRERAQRDAAAEAGRIRALASEEAARVERAADAEIAAAERAAVSALREMATEKAIRHAQTLAREWLDGKRDARIIGRFVEALGGRSAL